MTASPIGYSGHERGINVSMAACALGASIIERHITLDQCQEGADHKASLLPSEFQSLVIGVTEVWEALGHEGPRKITQAEMLNRHNLGKSIVARVPI